MFGLNFTMRLSHNRVSSGDAPVGARTLVPFEASPNLNLELMELRRHHHLE
jgi:hypothetical protein